MGLRPVHLDNGTQWQGKPGEPRYGHRNPLLTMADGSAKTEGGLPGMALHPDFNTTPHVFVAYNQETGGNYRERIEEVRSQKSECKNERI